MDCAIKKMFEEMNQRLGKLEARELLAKGDDDLNSFMSDLGLEVTESTTPLSFEDDKLSPETIMTVLESHGSVPELDGSAIYFRDHGKRFCIDLRSLPEITLLKDLTFDIPESDFTLLKEATDGLEDIAHMVKVRFNEETKDMVFTLEARHKDEKSFSDNYCYYREQLLYAEKFVSSRFTDFLRERREALEAMPEIAPQRLLNYKIPESGVISRPAASTSCRSFFMISAGIHFLSTLTILARLRLRTISIGANLLLRSAFLSRSLRS